VSKLIHITVVFINFYVLVLVYFIFILVLPIKQNKNECYLGSWHLFFFEVKNVFLFLLHLHLFI